MAKWTHVVEMKFEIELLDGMRIGGAGGGLRLAALTRTSRRLKIR